MLLKYLFPVAEINYLVLEKYFTKIKKIWSCFEDLVIKKLIVQSKINLNDQSNSYSFF